MVAGAGGCSTSPTQSAARATVDSARAAYDSGDYGRTIALLSHAKEIDGADTDTQVAAHKLLAFSYCVTNRITPCRAEFSKLRPQPALRLVPCREGASDLRVRIRAPQACVVILNEPVSTRALHRATYDMQLIVIEHAGEPVENDSYDAVVFHPPGGTIGRASDNHLVLRDDTRQISRLQALLQVGDDACLLKNLSSVSTIEVNREPVGYAQERPLNTGDIIRIGPYVLRAERDDGGRRCAGHRHGDRYRRARRSAVAGANVGGALACFVFADRYERRRQPAVGLLQDRLAPRGKAADAGTRPGPARPDAAQPANRAAQTVPPAPSQRDLHQLSIDPLDLFAQPSGDIGTSGTSGTSGTTGTAPHADRGHTEREASSATQADHAPEWTQHVRVQPAAARAPIRMRSRPTNRRRMPRPPTPDELLSAFFEGAPIRPPSRISGRPSSCTSRASCWRCSRTARSSCCRRAAS